MLSWPSKDPDEVLDYQINWALNRLQAGETIATSTWIVDSGSVVVVSASIGDGITTAWLSGGVDGEACELTNRIVTSASRTYDQSVRLRIREH